MATTAATTGGDITAAGVMSPHKQHRHASDEGTNNPQPRSQGQTLSNQVIKMEGEIAGIRHELKELWKTTQSIVQELNQVRRLLRANQQSASNKAPDDIQLKPSTMRPDQSGVSYHTSEQSQVLNDKRAPATTASIEDTVMPEKTQNPDSHNDYCMTEQDIDVAHFIKESYLKAEVVDIDNHVLTIQQLRPNVTKGFVYDEVINTYAHISGLEADGSKSFLTTFATQKLIQETGGPMQCGNRTPWPRLIAEKCIGRHLVFAPMNVSENHWVLLVLNFKKEKIQILNSIASDPRFRDVNQERTLVGKIQQCIDHCIKARLLVSVPNKPIDFSQWETKCYPDIPQQRDSHSCGSFVLKYMMVWNGEKMTEDFAQEDIDTFSLKICSSLLLSKRNKRRLHSYNEPITKEAYTTKHNDEAQDQSKVTQDDVKEISPPAALKICSSLLLSKRSKRQLHSYNEPITKEAYTAKHNDEAQDQSKATQDDVKEMSPPAATNCPNERKRARPRKTYKYVEDQMSTEPIAHRVRNRKCGVAH